MKSITLDYDAAEMICEYIDKGDMQELERIARIIKAIM